jgi:hypothetical protein
MSTIYKNYLLVQTFIELDSQISDLTRKISSDRFIEIGDDPHLIREIENVLLNVQIRVKTIEPYFDLTSTPMSKANVYFALIKHVSDALRYLQDVRRKDFGSQQHTQELLNRLKDCTESIYAIGNLATLNTEMVH